MSMLCWLCNKVIPDADTAEHAFCKEDSGWQTIETAPKDRDILLACPSRGVVRGHWQDDRYSKTPRPYWTHDRERLFGIIETRRDQPSKWMELPEPPK